MQAATAPPLMTLRRVTLLLADWLALRSLRAMPPPKNLLSRARPATARNAILFRRDDRQHQWRRIEIRFQSRPMHGGGPPSLENISIEQAKQKYGI
jgi:hypothetical protein